MEEVATQHNLPPDPVQELFKEVDLDPEKVNPKITARLKLLNETTNFVEDEHKAVGMAKKIFEYLDKNQPENAFSEEEKKIVIIGTVFSDIGKTGWKDAPLEIQRVITRIYGIESKNHGEADKMPLQEFVRETVPEIAEELISKLESVKFDVNMTMRQFWNKHALWSLEIISGDGIPPEAIVAAACHHLMEGVNPGDIVGKDGRFTRYFGDNVSFDRAEKLIILLDKFDAYRRRSHMTREQAVATLRKVIEANKDFSNDPEFLSLVEVINSAIDGRVGDYAIN